MKAIDCLQKHIATFGTPSELLSDRGFLSEELRAYLKAQGGSRTSRRRRTRPAPSTNGSIEGFQGRSSRLRYGRQPYSRCSFATSGHQRDECIDDFLLSFFCDGHACRNIDACCISQDLFIRVSSPVGIHTCAERKKKRFRTAEEIMSHGINISFVEVLPTLNLHTNADRGPSVTTYCILLTGPAI